MTFPSTSKYFLIGQEVTPGTPVSADKDVGLIQDVSEDFTSEEIRVKSISSIEDKEIQTGSNVYEQSLVMNMQHTRIFEYIFGSVSHAETTSDWKHTFTIANDAPYFTSESGESLTTDVVSTVAGNLIEAATLGFELNGVVTLDWSVKGLSATSGSSASAAVEDTGTTFPQGTVHVTINDVESAEVQSVSIEMPKNISQSFGSSSNDPQQSHATSLEFNWSATLGFTDKTYADLKLNNATFDFLFNAHNGITLGSGRKEIYLELENCKTFSYNKVATIGNLIFVTIEGSGTLKECFGVDAISDANFS